MIYFWVPPTVAKGKCSDTWNIRHSNNICFLLYIINVLLCVSPLVSIYDHTFLKIIGSRHNAKQLKYN